MMTITTRPRRDKKPSKNEVLHIRMTTDEKETIEIAAAKAGSSVAAFVRSAADVLAQQELAA